MSGKTLIGIGIGILSGLVYASNNYVNPYYFYFSQGYKYGKCLKVAGKTKVKGWAIYIPVKNPVVFAYYHYLLTSNKLNPVAVKNGIIADVEKDKQLLKKAQEIVKKLKLPYQIKQVSTDGYIFSVQCGVASNSNKEINTKAISKSASKSHEVASKAKKKTQKLPIDMVIEKLQEALKYAKEIGTVEPESIRTIYQIEFNKDKLIKDIEGIIEGLQKFKKETGMHLKLDENE